MQSSPHRRRSVRWYLAVTSKEAASVHPPLVGKFTGQSCNEETGLDDFGFRYNSSTLGHWMTPDPAGVQVVADRDGNLLS